MADRIENIHDDGTSTKISDTTVATKESDPSSENGEKAWKKSDGIFTRKCSWKNANKSDSASSTDSIVYTATIN